MTKTLQRRTFTIAVSTLLENGDFNRGSETLQAECLEIGLAGEIWNGYAVFFYLSQLSNCR